MLKRMKVLILISMLIIMATISTLPIIAEATNLSNLTNTQLLEALDFSVANGSVKSIKIENQALVVESDGFTIITLPSQQIPWDMKSYTYELDIIPAVFNGANYSGLIYGHMGGSSYTGRAQLKVKNDSYEFWCTGAPNGVMATDTIFSSESFGVGIATRLKIVVNNQNLTYYVNNIEVAKSDKGGDSGNLALLVTLGSTMAYDNIKVTNNDTSTIVYEEDFSERQVEVGSDENSINLLNQLGYSVLSGDVVEAKIDNNGLLIRSSIISDTVRVAMPTSMIPVGMKNYSYEIDLEFIDVIDGVHNGLFFGYTAVGDLSYDIRFSIRAGAYGESSNNGEFARVLYEQWETLGTLGDPIGEYASQSAALNQTLKIKIVQENNETKYYINDILTDKAIKDGEITEAQQIGIYLSKGCTVRIDNIVVSNLENANPVVVYKQNFDNQNELNEVGQTPKTDDTTSVTTQETTQHQNETTVGEVTTDKIGTNNSETTQLKDSTNEPAKSGCKKSSTIFGVIQIVTMFGGFAGLIIKKKS